MDGERGDAVFKMSLIALFVLISACWSNARAVVADYTISSSGYYTGTVCANQDKLQATEVVCIEVPVGYCAQVTAMQTDKRWNNADRWTSIIDVNGKETENPSSNQTRVEGTLYSVGYVTIVAIVSPAAKPWPLSGTYEYYNCDVDYSIEVKYQRLLPDLVVSAAQVSPSPAADGETVALLFAIRNSGRMATEGASSAKVYLDGAQTGGNLSVPELAAGALSSYSLNLPRMTPGTHSIRIVADAADTEEETNEANNEATLSLDVYTPTPYTVRFDSNGGSGAMSEQQFVSGTRQTLACNSFVPPSQNHVFAGWACSKDGDVVYEDGESVRNLSYTGGVVILHAVWQETFVINDGVLEKVNPGELRSLSVPYGVTRIGSSAFYWCDKLESVILPESVVEIERSAFWECTNMTRITLPVSLASIGSDAFHGCESLRQIVLPNGIENIPVGAFGYCRSLTDIAFPSSVRNIGGSAFTCCDNLSGVILPEGVTNIGANAFDACPSLVYAYIPSSVERIGAGAFARACNLLQSVIFAGNAPVMEADGNGNHAFQCRQTFDGDVLTGCTIYVPRESSGWGVGIPGKWVDGVPIKYYDHVITFDFNGGESPSEAQYVNYGGTSKRKEIGGGRTKELKAVEHGTGMGELPTATREGYTFKGWFTAARGGSQVTATTAVTGSVTLYAQWSPIYAYAIVFHRNDASDEKTAAYDFDYGVRTRLPTLNSLGWARRGFDFLGWAASAGNAARGTIWAADWGIVSTAAEIGETRDVYASWALKDGFYAIQFIRNDGAGTWRTVGFPFGEKTRMPTLAKGLGWARRGYQFNGWALSGADANNRNIWKGDWGYVATPVAAGNTLMVYASWSLKPGFYQIRFNKNDGSGKWRTLGFECGASAKLNTISGLGWEIPGKTFKGWGSNKANADVGKVWKLDGAWVKDATAEGKTLSIYAIWE